MRFRKLQIAWSVVWGVGAVLVCALWVRSYYSGDVVQWSATKWTGFQFTAMQGQLTARRCELDGAGHHGGMAFPDWEWQRTRIGAFGPATKTIVGFNWRHATYFLAVQYWVAILVCVGLAVVPVVARRWQGRFSLRALLVGVTVVALGMGLLVYVAGK